MTGPHGRVRAYDTVYDSEIELRGFAPTDLPPDVVIRFGSTPTSIDEVAAHGLFWTANRREVLLDISGVARYHVVGGDRITVEPASSTARSDALLFGVPLAAGLMFRGRLVLHAAAVRNQGGGSVAFVGRNGAGKSSLCAALTIAGWRRVCDNLGVVDVDAERNVAVIHPGPSSFRLWNDMAIELGLDLDDGDPVSEKIAKTVFDGSEQAPTSSRLDAVVCLETVERDEPRLVPLGPLHATSSLLGNHFRSNLARVIVDDLLDRIGALAGSAAVYRLERPATGCPPDQLARFVEDELALRTPA